MYVHGVGTLCRLFIGFHQPIVLEILTQQSCYKRAESNLLADEKGPNELGQLFVQNIDIYLYIFNRRYASWGYIKISFLKKNITPKCSYFFLQKQLVEKKFRKCQKVKSFIVSRELNPPTKIETLCVTTLYKT